MSCERKTGSGRPRTARSENNVETVRIMIEEDNTVSLQHLSTELDLHESTVYRILTNDLGKKSFCTRWVSYALTESQASTSQWCPANSSGDERERSCD